MCGIAGLWCRDILPGKLQRLVAHMTALLFHRGPDHGAVWIDPEHPVGLGHRRLSILDLSPAGNQPMAFQEAGLVLTFNGEIYNFLEIREELESLGYRFRSSSDTEVLLYGYAQWGTKVLDRLIGMFAFAIWDRNGQKLFLARDRLGEKPLYYAQRPGCFAFASEIQSLRTLPYFDTSLNHDAVGVYMAFQYIPSPLSIYQGIAKLPPAHAMVVDAQGVQTWRYWDPLSHVKDPEPHDSFAAVENQWRDVFRKAVRRQCIADVPVGAFLSGGVDSSTVVAFMKDVGQRPIQTYTIGFRDARFNESHYAQEVARILGTDHRCESFDEKHLLTLIPRMPQVYGEPFADPSALPTFLLCETARRYVKVCLSGDGGDELFGGYERYRLFDRFYPYLRKMPTLSKCTGWFGLQLFPRRWRTAAFVCGQPPVNAYQAVVGSFPSSVACALMEAKEWPSFESYLKTGQRVRNYALLRQLMLIDLHTYLPESVLTKVDRAAMANSLETRAPFLDHSVVEFTLKLALEHVRHKRLLKAVCSQHVPRRILDRPKMGFGIPISQWLKGVLRETLLDLATPSRLRQVGITNVRLVRWIIQSHMRYNVDHGLELWTLLALLLWHDYECRVSRISSYR